MKKTNKRDTKNVALDRTVAGLIERLRDAGVYGKWLSDYHRMAMRYGPAYIYKDVLRFEQERSLRS